jgi:predicted Zn-dependent peptidase
VPADELARAKNYVALRFPSTFEAIAQVSQRLEEVLVHKLPDDYFARYVQNIEAVTAADVRRVAEQYVLPARFTVLVVGDRKTIEPGIRALNLGPIKAMTIDEVFGPAPSVR